MIEIGRLCIKIAGRDSGKACVVVDVLENNTVLIDGETRRRKCSTKHLEPMEQVLKIKKGCSHSELSKELKKIGFEARETKPKKSGKKPVSLRGKAGRDSDAVPKSVSLSDSPAKQKTQPADAPVKTAKSKPEKKEHTKTSTPKKTVKKS